MTIDYKALDPALEAASKLIAASRAKQPDELPPLLFHYTNATGMRGILDSARLWATNYRYLNDVSEVGYGAALLAELVQDRMTKTQDAVATEFLKRSLHTANGFDGMFDCYIACFCKRDDLLTQWRTYASSGGGYALGFETKEIGRRWGQLNRAQDFVLRRVIYDLNVQRQLLSEVLDAAIETLSQGSAGKTAEEANLLIARCCHFVRVEVADYLVSFKHPAFEVEEEWRLCHIVTPGEDDHLLFRDGQFGFTPYVSLDVSPMAGVNHNKLPLSRITHGPTTNPDNVRFALNKLLRSKNYAFVEVAGSTLPVRVGA